MLGVGETHNIHGDAVGRGLGRVFVGDGAVGGAKKRRFVRGAVEEGGGGAGVEGYSDLIFVVLVMALVNDDCAKCK